MTDDAVCISALFRCLCRCLYRRHQQGRDLGRYPLLLLSENRWRAQRYGLACGFIDLRRQAVITSATFVDDLLEMIREDAEYFDCNKEVDHVLVILGRGTSADRQLAVYREQLGGIRAPSRALTAVVDQLAAETVAGCTRDAALQ